MVRISLLYHESVLTVRLSNPTVSLKTACLTILATTATGFALLTFRGSSGSDSSAHNDPPIVDELPAMHETVALPQSGYLQVGDQAPDIGPDVKFAPPSKGLKSFSGKVTVLDLWHPWCPYARELSPGLIQLIEDYADSPVQFLSLTSESVPPTGTPDRGWPIGYGAAETLKPFRCLFNDVTYGLAVHPTIYLIDTEGRISWCDAGMREQHADAAEVERSVREALNAALSQLPNETKSQPTTPL